MYHLLANPARRLVSAAGSVAEISLLASAEAPPARVGRFDIGVVTVVEFKTPFFLEANEIEVDTGG